MARSQAQKKTKKPKSRSVARPAKKAKPKSAGKASSRKSVSKATVSSKKNKPKSAKKVKKKALSSPRRPAKKVKKSMQTGSKRSAPKTDTTPAPAAPPRLLRQTKTTAAALALLEKGIQHIHKKDFKKARSELKALLETYPAEMDILARARSYIQICDREEAAPKKPAATTDQLYALGVMEHNKANYDAAISYFLQSLEKHPEADYIHYSVAASLAMKGNLAESMENLRRAVELNEDSKIFAKNDDDFSALHSQRDFIELVGLGLPPTTESES